VYDSGYEFFFHGFLTVLVAVNLVAIKCGLVVFIENKIHKNTTK